MQGEWGKSEEQTQLAPNIKATKLIAGGDVGVSPNDPLP